VELTAAEGMHDGNVLGVPYFNCKPKFGVFIQQGQLHVGAAAPAAAPVAVATAAPAASSADDEIETVPSKEKTADGSISLGQAVTWNGKQGAVRFIGNVKFAPGEWIGVELTTAEGMHDGNVLGVPYFSCGPKCGVFAQPAQLLSGGAVSPASSSSVSTPTSVTAAEPVTSKDKTADGRLWLGLAVKWNGRQGIVRYIGSVKFAAGEWVGVELIEGKGMHNGNVMSTAYFNCPPSTGIFAQSIQLQTSGTSDAALVEQTLRQLENTATQHAEAGAVFEEGQRVVWNGKHAGTVRFVGPVDFAAGEWIGVELDDAAGRNNGTFMGASYFQCEPSKGIFCQASLLSTTAKA